MYQTESSRSRTVARKTCRAHSHYWLQFSLPDNVECPTYPPSSLCPPRKWALRRPQTASWLEHRTDSWASKTRLPCCHVWCCSQTPYSRMRPLGLAWTKNLPYRQIHVKERWQSLTHPRKMRVCPAITSPLVHFRQPFIYQNGVPFSSTNTKYTSRFQHLCSLDGVIAGIH